MKMNDTTTSSSSTVHICECGKTHKGERNPFLCPECTNKHWGMSFRKPPEQIEEPKKASRGKKKKVHTPGSPPPKIRWGTGAEKEPSAGKAQYDKD